MEDAMRLTARAPLNESALELMRRFPTAFDLRARASRRMPRFAFEYMDGGAGSDGGVKRNWDALDAVELAPRYGRVVAPPPADCVLFGRRFSAPLGVSPIGGPGTAFPGAELYLAQAAQAARIRKSLRNQKCPSLAAIFASFSRSIPRARTK
jgi:L-lactate dehydrogenase (cytochrome)